MKINLPDGRVIDADPNRNTPCVPYPEHASYKTIALVCPLCQSWGCWRRYLSWEKALGIQIGNERYWPAEVDMDHRKRYEDTLRRQREGS